MIEEVPVLTQYNFVLRGDTRINTVVAAGLYIDGDFVIFVDSEDNIALIVHQPTLVQPVGTLIDTKKVH